jgi:hypothetical protein
MSQYSAEERMKWASQLEAIDIVLTKNNGSGVRYAEGILNCIPLRQRSFERVAAAVINYDWWLAVDHLQRIAEHAYNQNERQIAEAVAVQVIHSYDHFADMLHNGRAAEGALYHGLLDAYLLLQDNH